jgi:hypothetical protein
MWEHLSICTSVCLSSCRTKRTNRVASKNHTSGIDKNYFLLDLISRGLRGKHTEKSDQNLKKNFSVLAGLKGLQIRALADRYNNPIPTRFLVPLDCLKIPARCWNLRVSSSESIPGLLKHLQI